MRYYFFDIDGTLLLSGGAGRVAMTQVMSEMYGLEELNRIDVHGRTDFGIIRDLFASHDVPINDDDHQKFSEQYHSLLADALQQCDGSLMPGVKDLLNRLSDDDNARLGILTGNSQEAAKAKLEHFELDHYFEFGGYGQWHAERNDVAAEAFQACCQLYDDTIQPEQVWVVGDTVNDIRCARSIRANIVAVATGGATLDELQQHSPDVLLADLSCTRSFLNGVEENCPVKKQAS